MVAPCFHRKSLHGLLGAAVNPWGVFSHFLLPLHWGEGVGAGAQWAPRALQELVICSSVAPRTFSRGKFLSHRLIKTVAVKFMNCEGSWRGELNVAHRKLCRDEGELALFELWMPEGREG